MRRGSLVRLGLALAAGVTLAACRVDTEVEVTVTSDGSGEVLVRVTADADVVDRVDGLADEIRVDDISASGWAVEGPAPTSDGGLQLELRHPFATVAEANAVLAEISAPDGPLHDLAVDVGGTSGDIEWTFAGQLDLSRGLDAFADQDLIALSGGTPWLDVVTAEGLNPADVASVTFRVSLPGEHVDESGDAVSGAAEFTAAPGDAPVAMSSRTLAASVEVEDARDLEHKMWSLLAAYGAFVLAGVAVWQLLRMWRRNRRRARREMAR